MKKLVQALSAIAVLLFLAGCSFIPNTSKFPTFSFDNWTHVGKYGLFTDQVNVSGASWTINPDGSATLKIDKYDGDATYAGTIGPHDTFTKLVITYPAGSPQATAAAKSVQVRP